MSEPFQPPLPQTFENHPSQLGRMRRRLRSGLSLFLKGSYDLVGVTRHRLPSLPLRPQRFLFIVRDPAAIREMLVRRPKSFPKGALLASMLGSLTGPSLLVSNGAMWERQRRIVDQAFTHAGVRGVFPLMRDATDAAIDRLRLETGGARPVEVDAAMMHFASDVIFRTIYSEPMSAHDAAVIFAAFERYQALTFRQGMIGLLGLPIRLLPSALRARRHARTIRAILRRPLDRRLAAIARGDIVPRDDILAAMMAATDPVTGTRLDEGELLDQVAVLFFAGHETSAAALGWALYCIANRPDIQDEMRAEALAAIGDRPPEFGDMKRLVLTRNVFREALRLYPPIAYLSRDVTGAETLGAQEVPGGSPAVVSAWLMHRHTAFWRDANGFDPSRFASEETRDAQRQAYLPFGMGERVCIGAAFAMQEATLVLAELVRRFRIHPVVGHEPHPVSRLTVRSENGILLRFEAVERS